MIEKLNEENEVFVRAIRWISNNLNQTTRHINMSPLKEIEEVQWFKTQITEMKKDIEMIGRIQEAFIKHIFRLNDY